jgi:hypothetical protein
MVVNMGESSSMVRRYAPGAAAGTVLAVALTGCLGDGGNNKASGDGTPGIHARPAAAEALSQASEKSGTIKSFRATMSTITSAAGQETRMSGTMAYRLKPHAAMKMDFSHMTVAGKDTKGFQEILLGNAIYLKVPALTRQTGGKPWVRLSLSKLSAATGIDVKGLMSQSQQIDPAVSVRMLTASKDAQKVGTETVGGVSTTHYQGTYSTKDALARLGAAQREQAQKVLGQQGLDKFVFDLWVDGQQLPRKLTSATAPGSKIRMDSTMVYSGFNAPVSITAPPASQVTDSAKLRSPGNPNCSKAFCND